MNADRTVTRLEALIHTVRDLLDSTDESLLFQAGEIQRLHSVYSSIRNEMDQSLLADVPLRPVATVFLQGDAYVQVQYVQALVRDMEHLLRLVPKAEEVQVPAMSVSREGVFFSGQYFDALLKATQLLLSAEASIVLVDSYVDEKILRLLAAKKPAVVVRILTGDARPPFVELAKAFNLQHKGLSVRISREFHDRFVIIDDREFYHFGASLKDAGNRGFMFSRIEEPTVVSSLRQRFDEVWAEARNVV